MKTLLSMDTIINQIKQFADQSHGDQMRKYSAEKYIVHPIRVMEICKEYDDSLPVLAAALLHDVLEDTNITEQEMLSFLLSVMDPKDADETLQLVKELTDVYVKSAYPQWNRIQRKQKERERIADTSAKSHTIKYADIIDNTREITVKDPAFAPRYLKECFDILMVADKGNDALYKIARQEVRKGLSNFRK